MDIRINALALGVCVASNTNIILWGKPGQGKSTVLRDICKAYGLHLEVVIASIREPTDFAGIPYIDGNIARLAAPAWARSVIQAYEENEQRSIVFYDELSTATPATQAALLRPLLERVVGEVELPAVTRNVAAANPPDVAANGWELTPPQANRFTHIDWNLDANYVKQGFTRGWPTVELPQVRNTASERAKEKAQARALVGIFLGKNPSLVTSMPDSFSGSRGNANFQASNYAFPTPRSWEVASQLYAFCNFAQLADGSKIPKAVIEVLLQGTVGVAATKEFLAFARSMDLPDPEQLLQNPSSFVPSARGDILDTALSAVANYYRSSRKTPELWHAWGDILVSTVKAGKGDVAYLHMQDWNEQRPKNVLPTTEQANALQSLTKHLDVGK